jgi:DNA-binding transcriptional MerR regulator
MAVPARAYLSIGEVLNRLRGDFSDITISKIRFLESEGLIEPQRTPSGYRKFTTSDLDRLRYVLLAQRDQYLPLKVIKDNLDAIDRGLQPAQVGAVATPRPTMNIATIDGEISENPDVLTMRIACYAAVIRVHSLLAIPEDLGPRAGWNGRELWLRPLLVRFNLPNIFRTN